MRVRHPLLLAFVGSLALARGKYVPFNHDVLNIAGTDDPASPGLVERYALPGEQCNTWVGIEKIFMVEITEVSLDGSTETSTLTSCVATLTRSICATTTSNHPCYPCVMGTPASSDLATVTVTSCPTATDQTLTLTIQLCSTCAATIYIGTVPGYTPGGPCHGCSSYTSSSSVPCTESSSSSSGGGVVAGTTTTTTETSTATSTVSGTDCDESDTTAESGAASTTSVPPGNPGLPSTTTSTGGATAGVGGSGTATATAAPPVVTGGGGKNGVGRLVGAWVMGVVVVVGWM